MGVYIDMEMPSSCFDCPLGISVNFGVLCCPTHTIISDDNLFDADGRELRRQDWCPLIEVPEPHGRLGDLDALKTAFPCGESIRTESVRATIDHMPTIIQASTE